MLKHSMRDMLKLLGVAALYVLLAQLTLAVSAADGFVSVIWPPSGLALAVLLMGGKRYAWGVFLGTFLANAMAGGVTLGMAAAIATGNTLEALFGAWLVTRDGRFDSTLRSLRDYLLLIILAGFFGTSVSALTGTTTLLVSGFITAETYFHNLLHWWMGDALGIILITPLILVWWRTHNDRFDAKRMLEAILVIGLTFLVGQVVFLGWLHDTAGLVARGYWMYLLVTWAAVRLGTRGVVIVLIMTAVQALLGAYYGTGFFADDIAKTQLTNYWFYMVILSLVGMALATHFTERKQLEQQLSRRLRHRDVLERITQISLNSASIEELLERVLDEMLTVFNADRAYFLYPCDPDAPSWSVPMERTRPEWPGAFARGMVIPMTQEAVEVFRELLVSTKPLPYGPAASRCIPAAVAEQFSIRSMIQMALRPSVGSPWVIGLHHCAQARAYDEDDLLIFKDIGLRVADALNSMIMLANLRESEEQFRQLAENIREVFWMTDPAKNKMLYISPAYEQIWGKTLQSLYDSPRAWLEAIHGEDRERVLQAALDKQAAGLYDEEYRIVRPNGDVRWIHDRAFPVRDSGGAVYRIVGVAEDITGHKQSEAALRESEANMRTILNNMQDLFYRTDQYGQITMVSASVKAVLGYEQEDVVGRQVTDLYADPDARGKLLEKLEKGGGMVQGYEIVLRHKDGSLVWVSTNSHFYLDKNGNVAGVEGVGRDITGRKQAEAALCESEASMRAILDNSPYLVWLKDTKGRYIKINKGYADYIRLKDSRQIIGKTDFDLWPKELAEKYRADDAEVMSTLQQKYIEEQSLDGDRMHWVETFKTPILDENGNVLGTTGFARDITKRKQAEEKIHQLAFYDLLTGLPNRRLLNDRLGQTLAASKRSSRYGALMFMDLDNFKPLNDTHGHSVGDLLLIEVARRITSCVREMDTVARFGGDEFVVILSELDVDKAESLAQAGIVAEKIRAILAEPYVLTIPQEGKAGTAIEHHCTSSIGVVLFISYETSEDILKWADMAMYQAKESGRNLIRFFDSPHYL